MRFIIFLTLIFTLEIIHLPLAFGQQAQMAFGKNRIQRKNFNWQYYSTLNFDIYYYDGGADLAKAAAQYAETDLRRIEDKAGFTTYNKIKLIVYNSVEDLHQSNIGLDDSDPIVGGQTNFVKSKIEVAFQGSHNVLRNEIRFKIAEMVINVMLYGGSLKDIVQSAYLLSLPDWYVKGAAAFIAEGWSEEMDNYTREMFLSGEVKKPSHLTGKKAVMTGQSIWNFINEKYGKSSMGSILNLTRVMRSEEASIESTLGVPYSIFIKEWKAYYLSMGQEAQKHFQDLPQELKITKNRKGKTYRSIKISPDGSQVSYIQSYKSKFSLVVYNPSSKKKKTVYRTGQKLLHSPEDPLELVQAWQSDERLAVIEKKNGKLFLVFIEMVNGKKVRKPIKDFNQIQSFSFSPDGNTIVMSADKNGQSDIYIYDFKNSSYRQITNDLFDDLDPVFMDNNSKIAFASNRNSDTLSDQSGKFQASLNKFNIFIYQSSSKNVLTRVSEVSNNSQPMYTDGKLYYLSDEKGVENIYLYDSSKGENKQVSNFIFSPKAFAYLPSSGILTTISLYKGKELPYFISNFSPASAGSYSTERQQLMDESNPVVKKSIDTSAFYFGTKVDEEIDINSFIFESDVKRAKKEKKSEGISVLKKEESVKMDGPSQYRNQFGVERVNSTLMIDPLRGLGILMEADMADMMGNHRMKAGLFGLTDLKSSSVFGEYMYLKKRVDFGARFDRKTIYAFNETIAQRYILNRGEFITSYPLSNNMRISVSPFLALARYTDLSSFTVAGPDASIDYRGVKGEWVFDNTSLKGMNMMEGTRCRLSVEQFTSDDRSRNFGKFIFDLRHYQPVHREIIFATRLSYGQFFGRAPKDFLLGGMDNWLFNSTVNQGPDDPLNISANTNNSDLLFVEYVTNMRGFRYNSQFGPKFVLFNAELRVPLIRYFYNGVIHSNFLKNFQLVAFTDVGSAWSETSPFNRDNSTNTKFIGGGANPFSARVVNYRNPFLIGYGAGIRTLFLGYYMKFDVAWGVVNNRVDSRRIYLTLGYDF